MCVLLLPPLQLPDPAKVRPEHVLVAAVGLVKQKWKMGCEYSYVWEQLKAIRQDLKVTNVCGVVLSTHHRVGPLILLGFWICFRAW